MQYDNYQSIPGSVYSGAGTAYALSSAGFMIAFGTNIPRITDRGLLIEEARTNLVPRSSATAAQYPTGLNKFDTTEPNNSPLSGLSWITLDNSVSISYAYHTITLAASSSYGLSVLVETPDGASPVLGASSNAGDFSFILGGSIPPPGVVTYEKLSGNVWRVSLVTTSPAAPNTSTGIIKYTGQAVKALKFSGLQVELGQSVTSYIPTTGVAATRPFDMAYIDSSIASGQNFTEYGEVTFTRDVNTDVIVWQIDTGSSADRLRVWKSDSEAINFDVRVGGGGVLSFGSFPGKAGPRNVKFAIRREGNVYTSFVDGVKGSSASPSSSLPTLLRRRFGHTNGNALQLNDYIKSSAYAPIALTDAECIALTT